MINKVFAKFQQQFGELYLFGIYYQLQNGISLLDQWNLSFVMQPYDPPQVCQADFEMPLKLFKEAGGPGGLTSFVANKDTHLRSGGSALAHAEVD